MSWVKFTRLDWLGYAATLFALAVTFNAEYEIATAVHIHPLVAYAVPGALDVYVLRALQVRRDVFFTVLAMVLVNAASHLVTAGVLAVSPALIVAVSAIAPLVLWRAHVLRHEASTPEHVPAVTEHAPSMSTLDEHAEQAEAIVNPGTVNVSEQHDGVTDWDEHAPSTPPLPPLPAGWDGTVEEHIPSTPAVLTLVTSPDPGVLLDGDKEFLDRARDLSTPEAGTEWSVPTLRAIKGLGMGTDRARRLRAYLELEKEGQS